MLRPAIRDDGPAMGFGWRLDAAVRTAAVRRDRPREEMGRRLLVERRRKSDPADNAVEDRNDDRPAGRRRSASLSDGYGRTGDGAARGQRRPADRRSEDRSSVHGDSFYRIVEGVSEEGRHPGRYLE